MFIPPFPQHYITKSLKKESLFFQYLAQCWTQRKHSKEKKKRKPLAKYVNEWMDKNVNPLYCLRAMRGMLEWTRHLFLMPQIYTMGSHFKHFTLK